jgi:hypothetical protein
MSFFPAIDRTDMRRRVLFYRNFKGLTGGHLKVWDYFRHVQSATNHTADIHFTLDSTWGADNPWLPVKDAALPRWEPEAADIWFLAGMDWSALTIEQRARPPVPVINLIQHVRHADPREALYEFLQYPAVRVCVSHPVAQALAASGRVNGPIRVIENGIDHSSWPSPRPWEQRTYDVVICGYKQPSLGMELSSRISRNLKVCLLTSFGPRSEFLASLADTRVAVCLPNKGEGFYLPALEAMAQGALVVCPDCIGNRDFCDDGRTCWVPAWNVDDLERATMEALSTSASTREQIRHAVDRVALHHSLDRERRAFHSILMQIHEMWKQTRVSGLT